MTEAHGVLHGEGRRQTSQRTLLYDLIRKTGGHIDADELYRKARKKQPRISLGLRFRVSFSLGLRVQLAIATISPLQELGLFFPTVLAMVCNVEPAAFEYYRRTLHCAPGLLPTTGADGKRFRVETLSALECMSASTFIVV